MRLSLTSPDQRVSKSVSFLIDACTWRRRDKRPFLGASFRLTQTLGAVHVRVRSVTHADCDQIRDIP